ncbi:MAG TPA: glycosyltransferase family 2 protein [Candidatus Limnocylindrales bacterium]|nr:glycosyltransferase family 2 protein [Candidatus Limnocylindrales bacterium]
MLGTPKKRAKDYADIAPTELNPRCLCVLLCYNDGDVLEDVILHMLKNHHDIIVWDHGSDDETSQVLDKYDSKFVERKYLPRSLDFYDLYPNMSQNLIKNFINRYDWISWPDDDEILEGPDRTKTYYEHICDVYHSRYNYIQFNNFNYWFTEKDDKTIASPVQRIRHYSLFPDCPPRIRSWRASVTNIRKFNHNPLEGEKYPVNFNLRHYPMRSYDQMLRRINKDRANLQRGEMNFHYNNMKKDLSKLIIKPEQLLSDDGVSDLKHRAKYNWREIYGYEEKHQNKRSLPLKWIRNLFAGVRSNE